ncbi:hypothetical protein Hanom_Chr04g00294821 [Helianthus anomalus]
MKRVYEVFGFHQSSSVDDLRRTRCDLTEITSSRVRLSLFEIFIYSFGDNLHKERESKQREKKIGGGKGR